MPKIERCRHCKDRGVWDNPVRGLCGQCDKLYCRACVAPLSGRDDAAVRVLTSGVDGVVARAFRGYCRRCMVRGVFDAAMSDPTPEEVEEVRRDVAATIDSAFTKGADGDGDYLWRRGRWVPA